MTPIKLFAAAAALALAVPAAASAQSTPRADQRQVNQEKRIDQGVKSGALNDAEARRLESGQARVDGIEDRAKADGVVTKKERARIHKAQNVESKRIYRQKHDRQVKPQ